MKLCQTGSLKSYVEGETMSEDHTNIAVQLANFAKENGIDPKKVIYSLNNTDAFAALAQEHGSKILKMSPEELTEALRTMENGVSWGLGDVWWDVMRAAANNISLPDNAGTDAIEMDKVSINGINCLFTDLRMQDNFVPNTEYPYAFDIRHSDDDFGEPCTIEKKVVVNYFGSILSPFNFLEGGKEHCKINLCPNCDCGQRDFIYL